MNIHEVNAFPYPFDPHLQYAIMINVTNKKGAAASWINPAENKVTVAKTTTHTVESGDNLSKVATKYKTTVKN